MSAPLRGFRVCLVLFLASCVVNDDVRRVQRTIIDHVTILDGRGSAAISDARVEIANGRIVAIAKSSSSLSSSATIINGRGKFLVPGFIDMHAHLLFPRCSNGNGPPNFDRALSERALAQQLDFGITTVRSPATPTVEGLRLRDDLNAGRTRGPRAYASAEFINDATLDEAGLRRAVSDTLSYRPDFIKVYARLEPRQVSVVVKEAHRHNIPVIGHLQQTSWLQGIEAGVDHLAHSVDWSVDSLPEAKRAAFLQARSLRPGFLSRIDWLEAFDPASPHLEPLLRALARSRVSVDVTLMAYDGKFSPLTEQRYRSSSALAAFPELRHDWKECSDATADWTPDDFRRWKAAWPKLLTWIQRMHSSGVMLVSGTDLTNEWIAPGEGLHREFELLRSAQLTPNQILRMTGADAAAALRSDDIGIIEAGRRADLVLLSADPRADIRNTRSIIWVMQGGEVVSHGPRRQIDGKE